MDPKTLPIWDIHQGILDALTRHNRLVLVAPTGSGKTTQVPQMLLDAGFAQNRRVVILQPRRVAARSVAARVAFERQSPLGSQVGYQVRFDDQLGPSTLLCFVTEGILLRWIQDDPLLSQIGILLFDEFHERNLLSDAALALVKQLQTSRRPDLKIVVMSATLEATPVADYLGSCPILESRGQTYPVQVTHLDVPDDRPIPEQAASVTAQIVAEGEPGDILVFMPGMGEIMSTIHSLRAEKLAESVELIPLHGDLPAEDQDRAFAPSHRRKIIIATNVAETSITIDGIRHVVDSGLARVARYDAERGIGTLAIEEISRASADQRKGRAGRTAPGTCHRLWTESGHLNRPVKNTPEIQRADLAEVVLLLHSLGIRRAAEFDWLDKPGVQSVENAETLLRALGALRESDDDDPSPTDLTPVGRKMLRLPMHPRYSRMLIEASVRGCVPAAALCAALIGGRDLLMRLSRDDRHIAEAREVFEGSSISDFHTLMRAYSFARQNHFAVEACRRYGIHAQTARQIEQTDQQLIEIARREGLLQPAQGDEELKLPPPDQKPGAAKTSAAGSTPDDPLARCIITGFIDQLCLRRDTGTLECFVAGGRTGTLQRESVVQHAKLFVASSIREIESPRVGRLTLLGLATAAPLEWLLTMFKDRIVTKVEYHFDRTQKRVVAARILRLQGLPITHACESELDPDRSGRCLAEAAAKGLFELPLLNHDVRQFIARVNLVAQKLPELEMPAFHDAAVTDAMARAFRGLDLVKTAQATPLLEAFRETLGRDRLSWLDELAPLQIALNEKLTVKILYASPNPALITGTVEPEIQLKITDCLALTAHPAVAEGKVPLRIWICTPDGKRLEETLDWPRFRAQSYPKHRPALVRKFASVAWP